MGLARAGASIVLTGRREKPLEQSCQGIQAQLKQDGMENVEKRAVYVPCDVTDFSSIPELVNSATYLTGIPPTILVNNAGVNVRQEASQLTSEHWQTSLDLMLTAPFMLTRAISENMKAAKYGRVISISSLQAYQAFPDSIPYASAKSGMLGMTRALSEAYSGPRGYDGVTINAIAPGYVQTELTKVVFADKERAQKLADATLIGTNSKPEDLVGACLFLASPSASYVTGQCLPVDGGFGALGMR